MADAPTSATPNSGRRGPGAWPIVLIALGVLFLLHNLGALNLTALFGLLAYWPVALIAVGLNLLTSGRYRSALTVAAVALAVLLWTVDGGPRSLVGGTSAAEVVPVAYSLDGAAAARVTLDLGVGRVRIDDGAGSGLLASGSVALGRGESLEVNEGRENGTALLELRTRGASGTFVGVGVAEERSWALSLTREVPLALRVSAGVGENRIDLRNAQLLDLSFRGGVGESLLELPSGRYAASVEVGVGSTTVRVPADAAVRLSLSTGLGRADVSGTWNRDGDVYTTPGFETAVERIDLRVAGGVGEVRVERR